MRLRRKKKGKKLENEFPNIARLYVTIDDNKREIHPCCDCVHHYIMGDDIIRHFCNVDIDNEHVKELDPNHFKSTHYVACSIICDHKRDMYKKYLKHLEENGLKGSDTYLQIQKLLKE